jgi:hypothetical protein
METKMYSCNETTEIQEITKKINKLRELIQEHVISVNTDFTTQYNFDEIISDEFDVTKQSSSERDSNDIIDDIISSVDMSNKISPKDAIHKILTEKSGSFSDEIQSKDIIEKILSDTEEIDKTDKQHILRQLAEENVGVSDKNIITSEKNSFSIDTQSVNISDNITQFLDTESEQLSLSETATDSIKYNKNPKNKIFKKYKMKK